MEMILRERRGVAILRLRGDLNPVGMVQLDHIISWLIEKDKLHIVLNLAGVSITSHRSLGILVSAYSRIRESGGQLKITHLNGENGGFLKTSFLKRLFDICRDEGEAVRSFK